MASSKSGAQDFQREPAYPDDPYAYQDGYEEEPEERAEAPWRPADGRRGARAGRDRHRRCLCLSHLCRLARSGEPPIIKADNTPTKVMPAPADTSGKTPDRMPTGDGTEKIVPREEAPVDVNAKAAGRASCSRR